MRPTQNPTSSPTKLPTPSPTEEMASYIVGFRETIDNTRYTNGRENPFSVEDTYFRTMQVATSSCGGRGGNPSGLTPDGEECRFYRFLLADVNGDIATIFVYASNSAHFELTGASCIPEYEMMITFEVTIGSGFIVYGWTVHSSFLAFSVEEV